MKSRHFFKHIFGGHLLVCKRNNALNHCIHYPYSNILLYILSPNLQSNFHYHYSFQFGTLPVSFCPLLVISFLWLHCYNILVYPPSFFFCCFICNNFLLNSVVISLFFQFLLLFCLPFTF